MSPRKNAELRPADQFRAVRERLGLTREEVAEHLEYSPRQVARWESGESPIRSSTLQYLLALTPKPSGPDAAEFTFIDLFAGIGGFRMAFERARGRCVFTSEWDRYSQLTYRRNFGDHEVHGDIREIRAESIPDHDVLLAGFPCQPFSVAGVSKKNSLGRKHGFECETQGTLFFDIERIIAARQPKAFILENVKNLASHDRGRTFEVIRRTLHDKLGYRISWNIIDARCVVPQHRERIFIIGLRPDLQSTFDWKTVSLPPGPAGPRLRSILHPDNGSGEVEAAYTDRRGRALEKYVLSEHLWGYLQGYAAKHQELGNGFGFGLVGPDDVARTLSARYFKDGSEILIRRRRGSPRRLTPRECARLMGFDQPGRVPFRIPVSDTQAYRQFGNAVVVPVVERIARSLAPYLAASGVPRSRRRAVVDAA